MQSTERLINARSDKKALNQDNTPLALTCRCTSFNEARVAEMSSKSRTYNLLSSESIKYSNESVFQRQLNGPKIPVDDQIHRQILQLKKEKGDLMKENAVMS